MNMLCPQILFDGLLDEVGISLLPLRVAYKSALVDTLHSMRCPHDLPPQAQRLMACHRQLRTSCINLRQSTCRQVEPTSKFFRPQKDQ